MAYILVLMVLSFLLAPLKKAGRGTDQCITMMAMRGSAMARGIPDGACNPSDSRHGCIVDSHRASQLVSITGRVTEGF